MKRAIILSLFLCSALQAANEIRAFVPGATTTFAVVREIDGDVFYPATNVFEVWGTGARTAADYDIAMVGKSGGMFVGVMDADISAGYYYLITHQQAGVNPADTDPAIWQEYGYWSGTTWTATTITSATIADAVWDEVIADHTGETTFGGEMGGLDPNITLILADTTAYDTDAEHAAAIWNALMATYTVEASFGGEAQQLDPNITLIKAVTDILPMRTTTVSDANDANSFTVTAGSAVDYAYWGNTISVKDASDSHWESRMIISWTSSRVVVVDEPFAFTPANGDVVVIWSFYFTPFVYENLPKRISPDPVNVDYRTSVGGGTRTLDVFDNDP